MPFSRKAVLTCAIICLLPACGTARHEYAGDDRGGIGLDEPFDVSQYVSDSSVEVFSLDNPAEMPDQGSVQVMAGYEEGVVSSHDASVVVYPLPGAAPAGGRPSLMPPSGIRSYQSPFPLPDTNVTSWQNRPGVESSSVFIDPSFSSVTMPAGFTGGPVAAAGAARIFFAHNSDTLDAADRQSLMELVERLKASPGIVNIEGHASPRAVATDPEGRHIVNLRVSLERAFEVARFLIRHGVPAESIRTIGMGDVRPPASVPGMAGEQAARRVDIYVTPQ